VAKSSAHRLAQQNASVTSAGVGDFDKGERELMSVEFTPAKGGVVSETRMKVKGKGDYPDHRTSRAIHASMADATRHLKSAMGDCFGCKDNDEGDD
jgi:hypothetical protein